MRLTKALGVRRPLRSLPMAVLILSLAEHLGEEIAAAAEVAVREKVALGVMVSQQNDLSRMRQSATDTILHEAGNVANLYPARFQSD